MINYCIALAVRYDEVCLPIYSVLVRHLLESGKLEGGKRRATDRNWSPQIYRITN